MADVSPNPIPFSEPPYLRGLPSPYYTASHRQFQKACRKFMWEHLLSHAMEWEKQGTVPAHVFTDFCKHHMLLPNLPAPLPIAWLKRLGIHDILGVKVEEWDYLHTGIYCDEVGQVPEPECTKADMAQLGRSGLAGPGASLNAGFAFGIPPILKYGSEELQERVLPELLTGKKRACIAITEPEAGSDVANITTTATKSPDGKYYIINGTKKWITNGIWSDYTTMAVRTGGPGAAGLSVILVPLKGHPGVTMRRLKVSGQLTGGTTYIELDDVQVPVGNLIGREGEGMRIIMTNFNHERLTIAVGVTRQARVALASAVQYTMKREAFGKTLMDQPVVRHRLAKAGAELETMWAWVEQILYQLCHLSKEEADTQLGGITALAKAKAAMVLNECAQCAVLLFGGAGFTASGQGELVEAILRDVPGARIPGGSEDVLLDLAVRQLVKIYQVGEKKLAQQAKM
ncbi:acyl-CoA dehydrogenase family protein [Aspergillus clavatus NRRL 1]|uniref:Acyl-CoA dehydrogenase, putative n=1 Tax=Aspergillus clavatus (strain ATCC 1007 / CBS 513.65 / DSM 816 / NCTC 3887 / NRRL 1 / QM 1276 / 107) TaxID=344612 RepID=A1CCN2_ASPCL|nr:acyl-CoA dehydrogenase, putative [Aspergillus clavatus NRRL 1]EAW12289.1 acyl-CoA dehydrogenase, putative [Aspergillus clavatus NRRL 1]